MQTRYTEANTMRRAFAQSRVALARATDARLEFCELSTDAPAMQRAALALAMRTDRVTKTARRR